MISFDFLNLYSPILDHVLLEARGIEMRSKKHIL